MKIKKCIECGKEFPAYRETRKFCSRKCYIISDKRLWAKHKSTHYFIITCKNCKKKFKARKKDRKFCNRDCMISYFKKYPVHTNRKYENLREPISKLLNYIRLHTNIDRAELSKITGLAPETIKRMINEDNERWLNEKRNKT